MARKLSVKATIEMFSNENGFAWGINTTMKALVPKASYDLTSAGGTFIIDRWDSIFPQPTSQEIRDEYIRQQTIAECIESLKKYDKQKIGVVIPPHTLLSLFN